MNTALKSPESAKGFFSVTDGLATRKGVELAIVDGIVVLKILEKKPGPGAESP